MGGGNRRLKEKKRREDVGRRKGELEIQEGRRWRKKRREAEEVISGGKEIHCEGMKRGGRKDRSWDERWRREERRKLRFCKGGNKARKEEEVKEETLESVGEEKEGREERRSGQKNGTTGSKLKEKIQGGKKIWAERRERRGGMWGQTAQMEKKIKTRREMG